MSSILKILGTSTPVSEVLAQKLGYVKAAIACRVFFYQQLDDGVCRATVGTIAQKLGMSPGTVSANLKWLRINEYVEIVREHRSGNVVNKYKVGPKFYQDIDDKKHSGGESRPPEHSADESQHSADESNIQQMNGKEELKESFKKQQQQQQRKVLTGKKKSHPIQEKQKPIDPNDCRDYGQVAWLYEDSIGLLSLVTSQSLGEMVDEYGPKLVGQAIVVAVKRNKRNLAYVEGILKRAKAQGGQIELQQKGRQNGGQSPPTPGEQKRNWGNLTPEEIARVKEIEAMSA